MKVLVPIKVTDSVLISSNVPENDHPPWVAGTTYGADVYCISPVTHRIYRSLRAGNQGHDPADQLNRSGAAPWWHDAGATNRMRMFDGEVGSQTACADGITVVLKPGPINAVAFFGLEGDRLNITARKAAGGPVFMSRSVKLNAAYPTNWYDFWFGAYKPRRSLVISGIRPYYSVEITLEITGATAKCGVMAMGDLRSLGKTLRSPKSKPVDFSYIDVDEFGNNVIRKRKNARDLEFSALLDLADANDMEQSLMELLAVPCVCIADERPECEGLRTFGLIQGTFSYDHPSHVVLTGQVQGLI